MWRRSAPCCGARRKFFQPHSRWWPRAEGLSTRVTSRHRSTWRRGASTIFIQCPIHNRHHGFAVRRRILHLSEPVIGRILYHIGAKRRCRNQHHQHDGTTRIFRLIYRQNRSQKKHCIRDLHRIHQDSQLHQDTEASCQHEIKDNHILKIKRRGGKKEQ